MTLFRNWNEPYRLTALIGIAPRRATFGMRRRNEGRRLMVGVGVRRTRVMADDKSAALPEGTDKVIKGASGDTATIDAPAVRQSDGKITDKIRRGTENLSSQAGEGAWAGQPGARAVGRSARQRRQAGRRHRPRDRGPARCRIWRLCPPRRHGDRGCGQRHRRQGPRQADRGHAQFRPQLPGHRARRSGGGRLRRRPAAQDRAREGR